MFNFSVLVLFFSPLSLMCTGNSVLKTSKDYFTVFFPFILMVLVLWFLCNFFRSTLEGPKYPKTGQYRSLLKDDCVCNSSLCITLGVYRRNLFSMLFDYNL